MWYIILWTWEITLQTLFGPWVDNTIYFHLQAGMALQSSTKVTDPQSSDWRKKIKSEYSRLQQQKRLKHLEEVKVRFYVSCILIFIFWFSRINGFPLIKYCNCSYFVQLFFLSNIQITLCITIVIVTWSVIHDFTIIITLQLVDDLLCRKHFV